MKFYRVRARIQPRLLVQNLWTGRGEELPYAQGEAFAEALDIPRDAYRNKIIFAGRQIGLIKKY